MNECVLGTVVAAVTLTVLCACSVANDGTETSAKPASAAGRSGAATGDGGAKAKAAKPASGGAGGKIANAKAGSGGTTGTKDADQVAGGSGGESDSRESEDRGGSSNAGAVAAGDSPTARVAIETFEAPSAFGDWTADNSNPHDGEMSLHPPPIDPKTPASYEYSCEGKAINQVTFWLNIESVLDGQKLDLKVDGKLYEWFDETFYSAWKPQILTLPRGSHRFTWIASTTNSGEPAFWIDTIECFDNPEKQNTRGTFGFQEGFVPAEITGTFAIDNWRPDTSESTDLTAHPPVVSPADEPAYMEFSCGGKAHNKLTFDYATRQLSTGWRLKFFVDDQLKMTFEETYGSWETHSTLNASPSKAPKYKWVAEADVNGRPEVWIDNIKCE